MISFKRGDDDDDDVGGDDDDGVSLSYRCVARAFSVVRFVFLND